jgi:hypothetical protein
MRKRSALQSDLRPIVQLSALPVFFHKDWGHVCQFSVSIDIEHFDGVESAPGGHALPSDSDAISAVDSCSHPGIFQRICVRDKRHTAGGAECK